MRCAVGTFFVRLVGRQELGNGLRGEFTFSVCLVLRLVAQNMIKQTDHADLPSVQIDHSDHNQLNVMTLVCVLISTNLFYCSFDDAIAAVPLKMLEICQAIAQQIVEQKNWGLCCFLAGPPCQYLNPKNVHNSCQFLGL